MTHQKTTPARIAVLASGGGTNLQALIDRFNAAPDPAARVELVVVSRAGAGALQRAQAACVPSVVLNAREIGRDALADSMLRALDDAAIDLVVLAGYLQLVPAPVVERYHGRMLNVHPALLPAFGGPGMYGRRVHEAVIASGARVSGATVHWVDERYDEGRILAQWPVPVLRDDTPETLAARVLAVEHQLLPVVVEALATGASPPAGPADPIAFDLAPLQAPPDESLHALLPKWQGVLRRRPTADD
jgi:phosphoribosylglycinamide formyltransferase-1